MPVTLKDISKKTGVSVGTVSRALNEKSDIGYETASRIRAIAKEMGYVPDRLGRALSSKKGEEKLIGVLLPRTDSTYIKEIKNGVITAQAEYKYLGLVIDLVECEDNIDDYLCAIDEFEAKGCRAIAIHLYDDERIAKRIEEVVARGIYVIQISHRIGASSSAGFVGPDFIFAGKIAASLLLKLLSGNEAHILIITGQRYQHSCKERVQGFVEKLEQLCQPFVIYEHIECSCSHEQTQQKILAALNNYPQCNAIYMAVQGGLADLGAVLQLRGDIQGRDYHVIACDGCNAIRELTKHDIVDFVICEQPRAQGYMAIKLLRDVIFNHEKLRPDTYITESVIKIKNHFE